jgi:hypothetical protein
MQAARGHGVNRQQRGQHTGSIGAFQLMTQNATAAASSALTYTHPPPTHPNLPPDQSSSPRRRPPHAPRLHTVGEADGQGGRQSEACARAGCLVARGKHYHQRQASKGGGLTSPPLLCRRLGALPRKQLSLAGGSGRLAAAGSRTVAAGDAVLQVALCRW